MARVEGARARARLRHPMVHEVSGSGEVLAALGAAGLEQDGAVDALQQSQQSGASVGHACAEPDHGTAGLR